MLKFLRVGAPLLLILSCLVVGAWLLLKDASIPVLSPSGVIASQQRDLLIFTIALSAVVVIPVYGLLVLFAVKYRATNKKAKYRPNWGENKWLEALWWGIPMVVIVLLAVVTYQTSHGLDPYKRLAGNDTLEVQVVALRWKWLFLYPDEGVAALNQLPIPVNKPVHFTMTADAPMSAFWIPALGSQIYAMNGMSSELNLKATERGTFTGYTTNINGKGYANMTFAAKVLSQQDYDKWVSRAAVADMTMTAGVYNSLVQPNSETDQRTYRLSDRNLFKTIVDKYMGHGAHGGNG